jgi:hypothetical protein
MGANGKTLIMDPIEIKGNPPPAPVPSARRAIVGFIPFTPVPFTGKDSPIAFGRLVGYSLLAYLTFNKMRPASYALMGAAGVSLATSLLAGWGNAKETV